MDVGLSAVGLRQSESRLTRDAQLFWADETDRAWRDNSHWRGGALIDNERFLRLGREHLELFDRLAATVGGCGHVGRVLEWGVGGGANALAWAPRADEFVAVDVSPRSLPECAAQVASVCDTPVRPILATVEEPESVLPRLPDRCDLFLCLYVLELVPSPEYGLRLMRIAAQALHEGGMAFVQIKYDGGSASTRSRGRGYRRNPAATTTYRIEEFWAAMAAMGLTPQVVSLVPENDLDCRYAYFLLKRADGDATAQTQ